MLDSSGEKSLVIAPTSAIVPLPADLSEGAIAEARHLHTTAANLETATSAVNLAKKHGLSVSLDLEPTAAQRGADLQSLLGQVDVLFVNQRAVNLLTGVTELEKAARDIVNLGPSVVCVTMGEEGSLTIGGSEVLRTAAFPVQVVDSTGAGDCFAAAFVHGFLKGWSLGQTALFASAVGALSVTSYGGHTGAPTYDDVVAFLASRGFDQEHLL
jgi:sugar/nucleoside kinase (ribokinase family)